MSMAIASEPFDAWNLMLIAERHGWKVNVLDRHGGSVVVECYKWIDLADGYQDMLVACVAQKNEADAIRDAILEALTDPGPDGLYDALRN